MNKAIVVTGGAGFIGSNLIRTLNGKGIQEIIIVDHLTKDKETNLKGMHYKKFIDKNEFLGLIRSEDLKGIDTIIHLGANTNTLESNKSFLIENNTIYSEKIFNFCVSNDIKLIYASSAAVYGSGDKGYKENLWNLMPLNFYGLSKYLFDKWVNKQKDRPRQWVGLRFFNVYGPSEAHKGAMASLVFKGFNQIKETGKLKLFKSYNKKYKNGEQKRDFIFVKDVVNIILFFMQNSNKSGIFNVGTGQSRTFLDLGHATFKALGLKPNIQFIDMPEEMKKKYQYFTQADINKLRKAGYLQEFYSLEDGVRDYIQNYLEI